MTIQKNIREAADAMRAVRCHCMALHVTTDATHLHVTFPAGYSLDGVRVSLANGKKWACDKAIEKMERVWREG